MKLIQIFLPLYDNHKRPFERSLYDDIRNQLKDRFGGVTFYRNTAAEGLWEDDHGKTNYDELVIGEVMITDFNNEWWQQFKLYLQQQFRQEEVLIRSIEFDKI